MAQKQIYRTGDRLGFLPWGTPGRRLGAARWTDLVSETGRAPPAQITLASTGTHRLPEIPTLFRHNTTHMLPKSTIGAYFTIPQQITWHIDPKDSESRLSAGQLSVSGAEDSHFVLSAEVSGRVIESYECQIEERERVPLGPITARVRPIPEQEGMCEFLCNHKHRFPRFYESDSQNMELRVGNDIHRPTSHNITRVGDYTLSFGSLFNLHLSKLLQNGIDTAKAYWYNDSQVFTADVVFDYSDLQLESISPVGHFVPDEVELTELYSGDKTEELSSLELSLGVTTLHGWPVSFTITTPTGLAKIQEKENPLTIPIKRKIIQRWFDSPSENERHRSITLTPSIAGLDLRSLTSTAQLHLDVPKAPCLGYRGDRAEEWIKFLLRPQEEYHTIQQQHKIGELFSDRDWRGEISPEKLSTMNRNNIYRSISKPTVEPPVANCERVTELLSHAFPCLENRVRVDFQKGKSLAEMYGGSEVIDVDSTDLQILYSRQKFKLESNGSPISGGGPHNGMSFVQQGESLAMLQSSGTAYTPQRGDAGFDFDRLPEAFAYRTSNNTFTAPQTPGVYYLYVPSKGDHYLMEIEVHGFTDEVIE